MTFGKASRIKIIIILELRYNGSVPRVQRSLISLNSVNKFRKHVIRRCNLCLRETSISATFYNLVFKLLHMYVCMYVVEVERKFRLETKRDERNCYPFVARRFLSDSIDRDERSLRTISVRHTGGREGGYCVSVTSPDRIRICCYRWLAKTHGHVLRASRDSSNKIRSRDTHTANTGVKFPVSLPRCFPAKRRVLWKQGDMPCRAHASSGSIDQR